MGPIRTKLGLTPNGVDDAKSSSASMHAQVSTHSVTEQTKHMQKSRVAFEMGVNWE